MIQGRKYLKEKDATVTINFNERLKDASNDVVGFQ